MKCMFHVKLGPLPGFCKGGGVSLFCYTGVPSHHLSVL